MQQKKNIAPLICGIIGTVFGLVGGFLWVACADCIHGLDAALSGDTGGNMVWTVLFILFGLVGPVLGLIGAILAFGYKRAGGALLLVALLFCIGHIVVTVIYTGAGFFTNFVMETCTIFAPHPLSGGDLLRVPQGARGAAAGDPARSAAALLRVRAAAALRAVRAAAALLRAAAAAVHAAAAAVCSAAAAAIRAAANRYTYQPQQPWQVQKPQDPNDPDGQG